jgi:transcriptional regulator with XRE-family HTH domain
MDNGTYLKSMGKKIAAARKARKISQAKLSKLCKIDESAISRIEQGRISTRILTLKGFAEALGVDVKEFL